MTQMTQLPPQQNIHTSASPTPATILSDCKTSLTHNSNSSPYPHVSVTPPLSQSNTTAPNAYYSEPTKYSN
jgi:hypothetical protein